METFSATDASETSSSSASWTSLSESDGDNFRKASFLGDLLETSPLSSIEQISRRRLDASCMYVHNDSNYDSLSGSGGDDDSLPPTMARYDDIDFPAEDERKTEGERKTEDEWKKEDERKKRKHPGIRENIIATNSFLSCHLEKKDIGVQDTFDAKDYERYLIANSASPNAIQASLLYCIQNDDVNLVDTLLRDVGIEYLLRHCYLMTMHQLENNNIHDVDIENSPRSNNNVREANINIYWLACYYGSAQVLDIISQDTLAYFLETDTDHVSIIFDDAITEQVDTCGMEIEFGNAMTRANSMLTNLLEKPTTALKNTPLYTAAERDNGDVICVLLKYGANPNTPNKYGNTPALIASSLNNVQALQALDKSDIVDWNKENDKGMVPVLAASQCGNLEALRVLSKGIGRDTSVSVDFKVINSAGFSCTALAARYGQVGVIRYFSELHEPETMKGININQRDPDNETALHIAVRCHHSDIVSTLLGSTPCHCDVTVKNNYDMTALHLAARDNFSSAVRKFVNCLTIDTLALLDSKDKSGTTPVYYAALNGFLEVVKILAPVSDLSIMCEVRHSGGIIHRNQPALAAAASAGHVDIVLLLIQCGADINQTDDFGHTAVSLASKDGQLESVKVLVSNNADLLIRSKKGSKTPLQKARKFKHPEIVEYLEMHGGRQTW